MTLQEEIAELQARIAKAESERDTWRTSGMQDKYLEAYSLVEALALQLERLRQEGLRAFARAREPASDESQRELMAAWAITFRDGVYHLGTHRYDRLSDAVSYARLQRTTQRSRP